MRGAAPGSFFPYELKHAFPEGVLFIVVDHTERSDRDETSHSWGSGRALDSRAGSRKPAAKFEADARVQLTPRDDRGDPVPAPPASSATHSAAAPGADGAVGSNHCRLQIKNSSGVVACVIEMV